MMGSSTGKASGGGSRYSLWCVSALFLGIITLQWIVIVYLLASRQTTFDSTGTASALTHDNRPSITASDTANVMLEKRAFSAARQAESISPLLGFNSTSTQKTEIIGVAATMMFKAPKWFHMRYTIMIHNVLINLPKQWKVQIFINEPWVKKDVLPWHPALKRLMTDPRVVVTNIPEHFVARKRKPKEVLTDKWFWENVSMLMYISNAVDQFCTHILSLCSFKLN
jgi:hypothetical protein